MPGLRGILWRLMVLVTVLTAGAAVAEQPSSGGQELLEQRCVRCHDLKRVEKQRNSYSRTQWVKTIDRMIRKGSKLSDEEKLVVLDYLISEREVH